jgi:hypothetical protein
MQRALRQTLNWYMYSGKPWPFGKSERHLVVRAVLENRDPTQDTTSALQRAR